VAKNMDGDLEKIHLIIMSVKSARKDTLINNIEKNTLKIVQ